jgi:hypothetical protein
MDSSVVVPDAGPPDSGVIGVDSGVVAMDAGVAAPDAGPTCPYTGLENPGGAGLFFEDAFSRGNNTALGMVENPSGATWDEVGAAGSLGITSWSANPAMSCASGVTCIAAVEIPLMPLTGTVVMEATILMTGVGTTGPKVTVLALSDDNPVAQGGFGFSLDGTLPDGDHVQLLRRVDGVSESGLVSGDTGNPTLTNNTYYTFHLTFSRATNILEMDAYRAESSNGAPDRSFQSGMLQLPESACPGRHFRVEIETNSGGGSNAYVDNLSMEWTP